MSAGRLARAAAIVALFGLVSRLLGFAREVVLAAAYGATGLTDAYVNSLLIVNSVAAVLLYTLVTLIIPTFQRERADHGTDSAWRLVVALAVWVGALLIVLSAIVAIWPQAPAALFHLDPAREAATEELIRIMAPALALERRDDERDERVEQHRRDRVHDQQRVDVGVGEPRRAVRGGEHHLAGEAEQPGDQPEERDDRGRAREPPGGHRGANP